MKNLSIWLILFLSLNVISCTENSGRNQNNDKNNDGTKKITVRYEGSHPIIQDTIKTDKKPQRIKEIYSQYVQGFYFLIFEVDGHQYITQANGSITHLESCPCKTKKE